MSSYCRFYIGKEEVFVTGNELPAQDDPLLNSVFITTDKVIEEDKDDEENYKAHSCFYSATVKEVKQRFDLLHFTVEKIDDLICKIIEIPPEHLKFAIMDYDGFYDEYYPKDEDDTVAQERHRQMEEIFDSVDEKMQKKEFGYLFTLREVRYRLDQADENEHVTLSLSELVEGYTLEELEDLNIVSESPGSETHLEKQYLNMAKVHFTVYNFDLVYIEIAIALESAVHEYLQKKGNEIQKDDGGDLKISSLTKGMGLFNLTKFCIIFLGKNKIDEQLIELLESTINKRNHIIHNNSRRFKKEEVVNAINAVEKIIDIIDNLD